MLAAQPAHVPSIKIEGGGLVNGRGLRIKPDPEAAGASPSAQSDGDIYEDAGDLDFSGADEAVYLTRIPKFLWDTWSTLDDDQEIEVGRIRVEGDLSDMKRMSLLLDSRLASNRNLPKEYNMHLTSQDSYNTFIFSEKDLPGFRQFSHNRAPPHWMERQRVEKPKKPQSAFRRAVPKRTNLAGRVRTEINCLPVENREYQGIMDDRTRQALMKPKPKTQFVEGVLGNGYGLSPGMLGDNRDFSNLINTNKINKGKKQANKAARIPHNELLDLIMDAFKEYTYWPLKSLKDRLQQPEAYLKQVLEQVASMVKSGPHTSQWQLNPEARIGTYADVGLFEQAKNEVAPNFATTLNQDEVDDLDEDDDNVDMEDVLPE